MYLYRLKSCLFLACGVAPAMLLLGLTLPPAQAADRARALGIPFAGTPGPLNAITDVDGVTVGQTTIVSGGTSAHAARTGVTVVFPRGNQTDQPVPAGWYRLNGNGEMTGTSWITETGLLEGPVVLTNTHSVGVAHDAVIAWGQQHFAGTDTYSLPVVAETWDGFLNDINGFHVQPKHVIDALNSARGGPVAEGNVGGGTGMVAYRFKGGIGTASRMVTAPGGPYTLGVLVQANYGKRQQLTIAGIPLGEVFTDRMPERGQTKTTGRQGSIIVVVATDAPLLPHQLDRLARRVPLALGKLGSLATNSSGDLFVAFSTRAPTTDSDGVQRWQALPRDQIDPLFAATVEATEEAVVNALVAARTTEGVNGNKVYQLPLRRLQEQLRHHHRLRP